MASIELRQMSSEAVSAIVDQRRLTGWAEDFPDSGDEAIAGWVQRRGIQPPPWCHFFVVDGADGLVIGGAGCKAPPDDAGEVEIGYGIVPSRRRRGRATAAVQELVREAFAAGARSVRAETDADNVASQRVLEKAGFAELPAAAPAEGNGPPMRNYRLVAPGPGATAG